jgi:hypothetical protein
MDCNCVALRRSIGVWTGRQAQPVMSNFARVVKNRDATGRKGWEITAWRTGSGDSTDGQKHFPLISLSLMQPPDLNQYGRTDVPFSTLECLLDLVVLS